MDEVRHTKRLCPFLTQSWRAAGCVLVFFLVIGSTYIVKPVRESLLVSQFSPEVFPRFYLIVCGLALLFAMGFVPLMRRVPVRWAILVGYAFCSAVFLGFWAVQRLVPLTRTGQNWYGIAFYVWASLFNIFGVFLFWSVTDSLFRTPEAKLWYGWIGLGGVMGGIVGSTTAATLAQRLTTFGLLPIAGVGFAASAVMTYFLCRGAQRIITADHEVVHFSEVFRLFRQPVVIRLALITVLHTAMITGVDLQIKGILSNEHLARDTLTRFWGGYYAYINWGALGFNLLITAPVLRLWGPRVGLLMLPLTSLAFPLLLQWSPPNGHIWLPLVGSVPLQAALLVFVGVPIGTLAYTIQQAARELLYVPQPGSVRFQVKSFVDTFGFRAGNSVASLTAIAFGGNVAHLPAFSVLIAFGSMIWAAVSLRAASDFTRADTAGNDRQPLSAGSNRTHLSLIPRKNG